MDGRQREPNHAMKILLKNLNWKFGVLSSGLIMGVLMAEQVLLMDGHVYGVSSGVSSYSWSLACQPADGLVFDSSW